MGRAERNTRPHKTSGLEPATTPGGDESEGLSQQEDRSPKGLAEIHGDRPRPLSFRGVKLAPRVAAWRRRLSVYEANTIPYAVVKQVLAGFKKSHSRSCKKSNNNKHEAKMFAFLGQE